MRHYQGMPKEKRLLERHLQALNIKPNVKLSKAAKRQKEPFRPTERQISRETDPELKKQLVKMKAFWKNWVRSKLPKVCKLCGSTENLTIDHIKPVSKGGTHKLKNLQTLCEKCNVEKGDKWE